MNEHCGIRSERQLEQNPVEEIQHRTKEITADIIQGGMGVAVSGWKLARAVAMESQPGRETLGTLSGTMIHGVVARYLQEGGEDANDIIRVLGAGSDFPFPDMAKRVIDKYYRNPKAVITAFSHEPTASLQELAICANYAAVKLAKEEHNNPISINYLTEVDEPHLCSIYGAQLAGVDFVTMGAGIPLQIPKIFQAFSEGKEATYTIDVVGKDGTMKKHEMKFDPQKFRDENKGIPPLEIPGFLPIVSSSTLAKRLARSLKGYISGFIIEGHVAGGHNAPPRTKGPDGTKYYGKDDMVNLEEIKKLGLPFYLAGGYTSPEKIAEAKALGAKGVQLGTMFAFSNESGMRDDLKALFLQHAYDRILKVRVDFRASPTGYPFNIALLPGTLAMEEILNKRNRVCKLCALRHAYEKPDGTIGHRCPSEPTKIYEELKGGNKADTIDRLCLCAGLMAAIFKGEEPPLVTCSSDVEGIQKFVRELMSHPGDCYNVKKTLHYLFSQPHENTKETTDFFGLVMPSKERVGN